MGRKLHKQNQCEQRSNGRSGRKLNASLFHSKRRRKAKVRKVPTIIELSVRRFIRQLEDVEQKKYFVNKIKRGTFIQTFFFNCFESDRLVGRVVGITFYFKTHLSCYSQVFKKYITISIFKLLKK